MDGLHRHESSAIEARPPMVDQLVKALTSGSSVLVTGLAGTDALLTEAARILKTRRSRVLQVRPPLDLLSFMKQIANIGDELGDSQLEQAFRTLTVPDDAHPRIALLVGSANLMPSATLRYIELALQSGPQLQVAFAGGPGLADTLASGEFNRLWERLSLSIVLPEPPISGLPSHAVPRHNARVQAGKAFAGTAVVAGLAIAAWTFVPPSLTPVSPAGAEISPDHYSAGPQRGAGVSPAAAATDPRPALELDTAHLPTQHPGIAKAEAARSPEPDDTALLVTSTEFFELPAHDPSTLRQVAESDAESPADELLLVTPAAPDTAAAPGSDGAEEQAAAPEAPGTTATGTDGASDVAADESTGAPGGAVRGDGVASPEPAGGTAPVPSAETIAAPPEPEPALPSAPGPLQGQAAAPDPAPSQPAAADLAPVPPVMAPAVSGPAQAPALVSRPEQAAPGPYIPQPPPVVLPTTSLPAALPSAPAAAPPPLPEPAVAASPSPAVTPPVADSSLPQAPAVIAPPPAPEPAVAASPSPPETPPVAEMPSPPTTAPEPAPEPTVAASPSPTVAPPVAEMPSPPQAPAAAAAPPLPEPAVAASPPPSVAPPVAEVPSPPQAPAAAVPPPPPEPAVAASPIPAAPAPPPMPVAPRPATSAANTALAEAMVQRADTMLRRGDVSAARLLYDRAANSGSGRAATAMGKTFDAAFLAQIGVAGARPDPDQAAAWYRRAVALGDKEAQGRLQTLQPMVGPRPQTRP